MGTADKSQPAVLARGLTKRYGDLTAVDGIDLQIERGECFGFLGPNGAGKTTTMRMIYGRTPPTAGTLHVLGLDVTRDIRAIKARIGIVPQEDNLDPDFSALQNLTVYANYFGLRRAEALRRAHELLDFARLSEKAGAQVDALSGGMKRRLVLARGLINRPQLVVLDEPTTGLDPQARHLVWDQLRTLKGQGVTLLLTTHYMDEAERLCDRIAVIDRGRILALDTPAALIEQYGGGPGATLEDVFLHLAGRTLREE